MNPRCFGLPSVFHRDTPTCAKCPVMTECEKAALAKALALAPYVQIGDVVMRLRNRGESTTPAAVDTQLTVVQRTTREEKLRLALTEGDRAVIAKMPVKVREKAEYIMRAGKDVEARESLSRGVNPFPLDGSRYLHVACDLLIKGGFTRAELRDAYMERLGWSRATAASEVSTVVNIFPALKFAKEVHRRFVKA